jgi:hypothetical protein
MSALPPKSGRRETPWGCPLCTNNRRAARIDASAENCDDPASASQAETGDQHADSLVRRHRFCRLSATGRGAPSNPGRRAISRSMLKSKI